MAIKFIKFSGEVLSVPEKVTFWIMNQGEEYQNQYCVNMSCLEKQNFCGEPSKDSIIRSEGYKTYQEADIRLNEIYQLLNNINPIDINKPEDILFIPIDILQLSLRAINCLKAENIFLVGDIVCNPSFLKPYHMDLNHGIFSKLLKTPNLGRKSFNEIINVLHQMGYNRYIDCPDYLHYRMYKRPERYTFPEF